ncbi:MAG: hypothetical protein QF593_12875, partial [Nitrospinota bacterium]|nr:hypothetical protein [Nitrospinota bacterium]
MAAATERNAQVPAGPSVKPGIESPNEASKGRAVASFSRRIHHGPKRRNITPPASEEERSWRA